MDIPDTPIWCSVFYSKKQPFAVWLADFDNSKQFFDCLPLFTFLLLRTQSFRASLGPLSADRELVDDISESVMRRNLQDFQEKSL